MRSPEKSVPEIVQELWALLQAYARQETVDPLRSLGRYLGFGLGGGVLLGMGGLFVSLAGLRAMQEETDVFDGFWSWAPYVIVVVVLAGVIGLTVSRISKARTRAPQGGGA